MKVKRILANAIPRIKPIATSSRWLGGKWYEGPTNMWEISWKNQHWYVYKGRSFPYPDVWNSVSVKQIGQYYYWKGTYKY